MKLTNDEYIHRLKEKDERFITWELKLCWEYQWALDKIVVKTKYGYHKVRASKLLEGRTPTFVSTIYKDTYIMNIIQDKHNHKYTYLPFKYKHSHQQITIYCNIHWEFKQRLSHHIEWAWCTKCIHDSYEKNLSYYIKKIKNKHWWRYKYWKIKGHGRIRYKTIEIKCSSHWWFEQELQVHSRWHWCTLCWLKKTSEHNKINPPGRSKTSRKKAADKSRHFEWFMLYVVKLYNDYEEFYKIWRTFTGLSRRFQWLKCYKYDVMFTKKWTAEEIFDLEAELKRQHNKFKYIPKISFWWMHECYENILLLN